MATPAQPKSPASLPVPGMRGRRREREYVKPLGSPDLVTGDTALVEDASSGGEEERPGTPHASRSAMPEADTATGISPRELALVSVLHHALQGAHACQRLQHDASVRGERELAAFFQQVLEEQQRCAQRARELLVAPGGAPH